MTNIRKQIPDSEIMDALDAADMKTSVAADTLGVTMGTLARWIRESPNLAEYKRGQLASRAAVAWEKLEEIVEQLDHTDKDFTGHVVKACKIMIDKVDADKTEIQQNNTFREDKDEVNNKLRELLKPKKKAKSTKKTAKKKAKPKKK